MDTQDSRTEQHIAYSIFSCRFGICLVATTVRGVCAIYFADDIDAALRELKGRHAGAVLALVGRPEHDIVERWVQSMGTIVTDEVLRLPIDVEGSSDFERAVWLELRTIPRGETRTYGDIADKLGGRKYSRAVGRAVGRNPIGYLVPCHRVIRGDGGIGGYRWGVARKRMMLDAESGIL